MSGNHLLTEARDRLAAPSTTPRGRALLLARAAWLLVALLALGILAAGVPVYFAQLQTVDACRVCGAQLLTVERLHELQTLGISVRAYAAYYVRIEIALVLVYWTVAALIFWRKSADRLALFGAFMLLTWAAAFTNILRAAIDQYPSFWLLSASIAWMGATLFLLFFCLFPDGRFVPRWLAVGWSMFMLPASFFPESTVERWPPLLVMPLFIVFLVAVVGAQVYRYRRVSNQVERQQTRWVVFGMAVALMGFVMLIIIDAVIDQTADQGQSQRVVDIFVPLTAIYVCIMLIPISIGIAILRSGLWDIDVLINRTLVYGTLTVTLVLMYVVSIVLLQQLVRWLTGQTSELAIVVSTLTIAALFQPLRSRVQAIIDRRFYRRKYDAQKTLAAFSARLRDETNLDQLTGDLIGVVEDTLQPAHVSLWLCDTDREGRG